MERHVGAVAASSVEGNLPHLKGDSVVDGQSNTRWSSVYSDPQWISIDMGGLKVVNKVTLTWETAFGKVYDIQVSDDNADWKTVHSESNGNGGTDEINLSTPAVGRYIRMFGKQRGTGWGYSLWEFNVQGSAAKYEYEFVPHLDSGGNDIGNFGGKSIEEMKALADNMPDVAGFNSNGWFKRTLRPRAQWGRWTNDAAKGFYVKKGLVQEPKYEYEFVPHLDSGGNDIGRLGAGMTIEQMKALANENPKVAGFNSNGWFKHTLRPRAQWGRWTNDAAKGFYVKKLAAASVDIEGTRASAEEMTNVGSSLGSGFTDDPPTAIQPQPLSQLIASGQMPQYDLYNRLVAAVSNNQLTFDRNMLGSDYAVIADLASALIDVFVPIRNVKVEFAKGQPGMVGAPGMEVKSDPSSDGNLATPEDHAVKVSGDVNMYGLANVKLEYADFFHYKGDAHASFKFVFADPLGVGTFLPGVPLIQGLQLSGPTIIVATASTLYDPGLDSGINEGFNFFGNLKIADSNDEALRFIGGILRIRELAVHAAVDTSGSTPEYILEAAIQRDITIIDGDNFKLRFTRSDIGIAIKGKPPEPSLAMSNDLVVTLKENGKDTHLVFTGGVKIEPESITAMFTMNGTGRSPDGALSGSVQSTGEWREPFGIPGVIIRQMAVQVGFTYLAPWIDNVGVHGNLKIGDVDGSISVLVDTNDADNFVLAGSTDRITILEVMSAVSPVTFVAFQALPSALKNTLNKAIDVALEDVKVNIVPNATSIGGVHFRDEGFTIAGKLVAWGWQASAYVNVDTFDGITARADMDPLDILGVLKVTGAGSDPAPILRLKVSPSETPFLYVSGKVYLLGLTQELRIEANESGLQFDFKRSLGSVLTTNLSISYLDHNFSASGSINFNLNLTVSTALGDITLVDIGFNAGATIRAGRDAGFYAQLSGSFRFYGSSVNFPTLTLHAAPSDFQALYSNVLKQIGDNAMALFGSLFGTIGEWANAVKDGAIAFAGEVADVAKNVYNVSAQAAAETYKSLSKGANAAAKGLSTVYNLGANEAAKALRGAEYAANEVAGAMEDAFDVTAAGAAYALKYAGYGVNEVGKGVTAAYNLSSKGVAAALKGAGYAVGEVGDFMKNVGGYADTAISGALKGAGYAVNEVGDFMGDVFGGSWIPYIDIPAPYIDLPHIDYVDIIPYIDYVDIY